MQATRWGRLLKSLPRFMFEGVLQALRSEYGARVEEVLSAEWSLDWSQWDDLADCVRSAVDVRGEECLSEEDVLETVRRVLRAHVRLSAHNAKVTFLSDRQRIQELMMLGLVKGKGEIFCEADGQPANQCLADSLLQLLVSHGFLNDSLRTDVDARIEACAENRRRFVASDGPLQPRDRDPFTNVDAGLNPRAFLQHDRHADPSVRFFIDWFRGKGLLVRDLPAAGVVLTVRSRFDSADLPPDMLPICVGAGVGAGPAVPFNLYNVTGEGISGSHYDPLFPGDILLE